MFSEICNFPSIIITILTWNARPCSYTVKKSPFLNLTSERKPDAAGRDATSAWKDVKTARLVGLDGANVTTSNDTMVSLERFYVMSAKCHQ